MAWFAAAVRVCPLALLLAAVLAPGASAKDRAPRAVGQWDLFEGTLQHPAPPSDPLRGVTLETEFVGPDGRAVRFWGFHDGGAGWRFRFSPDQPGRRRYRARFSDGAARAAGEFSCEVSALPGPLTRWRENRVWFATAAGRPVVLRGLHVGDRFFAENLPSQTRTAFLDWTQARGYNLLSIASLYLNRDAPGRGQCWRTPRLWNAADRRVEPGEYAKAEAVLRELRERHFFVFPFAGFFGRHSEFPEAPADQELYLRYSLARFAPYWNVLLNLAGPEPLWHPEGYRHRLPFAELDRLGQLVRRLDPFGRLLSIHNASGDDPFRFSSWSSFSTLQGGPAEKGADYAALHHFLFRNHTGDRPLYAQEVLWPGNRYHARLSPDQVRRKALVMLFSGATIGFADMNGDSSTGYSGTLDPEQRQDEMHGAVASAWDFFARVPFGRLRPAWDDVAHPGVCLGGEREAWVYLPEGGATGLVSPLAQGWKAEWIWPRGDRPPAPAEATGERRFVAPGSGNDDVVLHLWAP